MAQDGPRRIGAVPPSDPRVNQLVSALGKPWPEGKVLKIVDGKPQWADASAGGAGGACAVTFSGYLEIFPLNNYKNLFPYDRTVLNTGGFTVNTGYSIGAHVGTAIEVPADGVYQFGMAGAIDFTPSGADTDRVQVDVVANGAKYAIASQIRVPGVDGQSWDFTICSNPLLLAAGDPIYTGIASSLSSFSHVKVNGTPTDETNVGWNVTMWARQLA